MSAANPASCAVGIQKSQGMEIVGVPFQSPSFSLFALNGNLGTNIQQAWMSPTAEPVEGYVRVRLALARTQLRI